MNNLDFKVTVFRRVNKEVMSECLFQCLTDAKDIFKYFAGDTVPKIFGVKLENLQDNTIVEEV